MYLNVPELRLKTFSSYLMRSSAGVRHIGHVISNIQSSSHFQNKNNRNLRIIDWYNVKIAYINVEVENAGDYKVEEVHIRRRSSLAEHGPRDAFNTLPIE